MVNSKTVKVKKTRSQVSISYNTTQVFGNKMYITQKVRSKDIITAVFIYIVK